MYMCEGTGVQARGYRHTGARVQVDRRKGKGVQARGDHRPQVELGAGTAGGVYREVILLLKLLEEAEVVALTSAGTLELFHQEHHRVMDQAQHANARHPGEGELSQPGDGSGLLHPFHDRFPGH